MKIYKVRNFKDSNKHFYMMPVFGIWVYWSKWYNPAFWSKKEGYSILDFALECGKDRIQVLGFRQLNEIDCGRIAVDRIINGTHPDIK